MSEPVPSAAVILCRTSPRFETFLVLRSPKLRFLGGHLAFPGGCLESTDGDLVRCAARELYEETGILAARPKPGQAAPDRAELELERPRLEGEGAPAFWRFLAQRGLEVDADRFAPAGRLVTPRFSKLRYDTAYFLLETDEEPRILPGELAGGSWHEPGDLLAAWRRGETRVAPPVVGILEILARQPLEPALAELRAYPAEFEGSGRSIPLGPGYEALPFETPPLPPEIPTNAILAGGERFVVIDPGPRSDRCRDHLFAAIDRRIGAGDRLTAVVLTHHHPDHVGALEVVVDRYRVPVWAHEKTGALLGRTIQRTLADGDAIELGGLRGGRGLWRLRVLHTPGHAEDHLVLLDEEMRALIAGDLVSTLVSMYVGAPGGSLRDYFRSLERVRGLGLSILYPAHGFASFDPVKLIDDTLRHRRERIEEVRAALREEPREPLDVALEVYPEAQGRLRPLIVRTTRAALEYLAEERLALRVGADAFSRAGPGDSTGA